MRKILLLLLMVIFIGCADNCVSSANNAEKRCDYTIHYFHPNIDEIISLYASASDSSKMSCHEGMSWCFNDLYSRVISDDTVVYKNELWTEEELNEHLSNNLPATADDQLQTYFNSSDYITAMLNELEKRQGELLNVSCYDVKYVTE